MFAKRPVRALVVAIGLAFATPVTVPVAKAAGPASVADLAESLIGAVVNITAEFGLGLPDMGHSGAARAGMDNFTKTAALEWAHSNVRVNAVAPGWCASSGYDQYPEEVSKDIAGRAAHVPLKRHGTEAEVSAAVVFLLSDAASYLTGISIPVDGGAPLERGHRPSEQTLVENKAFQGFHRYVLPKVLRGE